MKIGFYKVDNSLDFDRHSFDNMDSEQIELHLQSLLEKDEAAIVNLEDPESVEYFTEEYNNEIYDLGWWCVLIRDYQTDNNNLKENNGVNNNIIEKLSWLLSAHYNTFHADMILRAAFDDSISQSEFLQGCVDIYKSEKNDGKDEFTPEEFKKV